MNLLSIYSKIVSFTQECYNFLLVACIWSPVVIGPDNNVYSVIGHVAGDFDLGLETKAQNFNNGSDTDGTNEIHRVTLTGNIFDSGILGSTILPGTCYAYRIRNTFGMLFDPITLRLWISKNGVTQMMRLIWWSRVAVRVYNHYMYTNQSMKRIN
jgi:hypothetical protein